jgi:hypothetical protein
MRGMPAFNAFCFSIAVSADFVGRVLRLLQDRQGAYQAPGRLNSRPERTGNPDRTRFSAYRGPPAGKERGQRRIADHQTMNTSTFR